MFYQGSTFYTLRLPRYSPDIDLTFNLDIVTLIFKTFSGYTSENKRCRKLFHGSMHAGILVGGCRCNLDLSFDLGSEIIFSPATFGTYFSNHRAI